MHVILGIAVYLLGVFITAAVGTILFPDKDEYDVEFMFSILFWPIFSGPLLFFILGRRLPGIVAKWWEARKPANRVKKMLNL